MRKLLPVLVAVVLPALSAPHVEATTSPDLVWSDCPPPPANVPDDPRMRCATLEVPLDHRAPHGRTIEIAISKIATAEPGLRRGVLLHNGGGPGAPSLHLPAAYATLYPPEVLDRYDLIGFDPRGVGYSAPVTCGRTADQYPVDLYFPFPAPNGSIDRNAEFARELARDCLAHGGPVMPHVTTANTARDVDRVRIALGERKISYNSGSYGSYLGAVYATLFPDRTDRFVLDSNADPDRVWHEQFALWDHGMELRFRDIAAWLAERDATYHLGTTPAQVRQRYFDTVAELDANPAHHPAVGPITGNVLRAIAFAYSYHTALFPTLAEVWVYADQGGAAPEAPGSPAAPDPSPALNPAPAPDPSPAPGWPPVPADNVRASQLSVLCGDTRAPRDLDRYRREVAAHRALFPVTGGMGTNVWPCAFWHDPVERPVEVTDEGPANVLMVQTLRDPATPYLGALGLKRALGQRARLVTVDSGNHGAYDPSTPSCAVREANRFLETGVLPARDLFCAPDPAPPAGAPISPLVSTALPS
ncbi:alpha/beta hydrolase [Saccharothrix xinjiangensis]|uniref:Alpha/beta hydrolase n=1 Tax=Saccharothrix xinjiangensis TaxID=204798 RepID=A0ABV9YAG3_9PSEU